jgi:hypothetical protein
MNEIPNIDRARVTAILARLISELAGGDSGLDQTVTAILSGLIEICCRSKMQSLPDQGRAAWESAVELVSEKDWLLTVKNIGGSFEIEAKFGHQMKTAGLQQTVGWLSKAGTN